MTANEPGRLIRFDELDRRTVAALQADPRASWSQLSSVVGVSETTVMRRVQRLRESGALIIIAMPDVLKCALGQPVLVQFRTVPGKTDVLARYLSERPDVRALSLLAGSYDITCELIAPNEHYLGEALILEIPSTGAVASSSAEIVLRTFKTNDQWSREVLDGESTLSVEEPDGGEPAAPGPLDPVDSQLIAALNPDARRSYADLSHELGLSETAIARRLSALRQSGKVYFVAMIDPRLIGYDVEAFLHLRVELGRLESAALRLAEMPAVRYLSATTGESDLVCEVIFRDSEALYEFVAHTLATVGGIRDVRVDVEVESIKRGFRYPFFGAHSGRLLEARTMVDRADTRRTRPAKAVPTPAQPARKARRVDEETKVPGGNGRSRTTTARSAAPRTPAARREGPELDGSPRR